VLHYRIEGLLGRGGMGEIYRAYDTRLGRYVALKFLSEGAADAAAVKKFVHEARAASALNHPNIITVHDIAESEAGQFIVMELVDGKTLRDLINARSPVEAMLPVLTQVTGAISAAHEAGIVHRDIKPENVMVRHDGYVKLLDFGLSRPAPLLADSAVTASVTMDEPGRLVGTVRYMSPEQASGEPVDAASDIFSLGVVFYEVTTWCHPFEGDSLLRVLGAIASLTPVRPSQLNPGVSTVFDELILGMLEKDKTRRPTAADVDRVLSLIASGQGTLAAVPVLAPKRVSVGRTRERAALLHAFDSVSHGESLLVCVPGEPGLGKTTLIEELLHELAADHDRACYIGRGRCSERLEGTGAYLPFIEALEHLLQGPHAESVVRAMKGLAPTWHGQIRKQPVDSTGPAPQKAMSPERLKRELVAFLQEISRVRPLVLFLDDLHWADASTVDLINYVAARFDTMRVLVIGTYRPEDLQLSRHPFLQVRLDLLARGICQDVVPEFLEAHDAESYLELEFPGHRFPPDFARAIHAKTEGSPLFMVNVIRYLRDRNVIAQSEGSWSLVESVPDIERDLPPSVRSMIEKKVDQLSEADRRLLAVAGVQGTAFDSLVLSEALDVDAGETEERLHDIDRVHGFVRLVGEREFSDGMLTLRYRFVHVLYQHVVQSLLTPTRRVAYSARVANTLLRHYGQDAPTIAAELALLFETGREFARAAEYFLAAAQNSARLFANREAAALAKRGLALLSRLPESEARARQELKLRVTLGVALMSLRGYVDPEVEEAYTKAAALCERLGESMELFPTLWGLVTFHHVRAEMPQAVLRADQLLRLAENSGSSPALLQAHNAQGITGLVMAKTEPALEHFNQVIALYDPARHAASAILVGHDPGVLARCYAGRALWYLGYPDRALDTVSAGLEVARARRHPYSIVFATGFVSFVEDLRRDFQSALHYADEAIRLATEEGFPLFSALCGIVRGWARVHLTGADDGLTEMQGAMTALQKTGTEVTRSHNMTLLADALARLGRFDACIRAVDDTLAWTSGTGVRDYDAELYRIKGAAVLASTQDADVGARLAEDLFTTSLEVARGSRNRSWELRTATDLAHLWHSRHRPGEAQSLLADVYRHFTEGHETHDLRRARELLHTLSGVRVAGP
jgi:predicted ATPase